MSPAAAKICARRSGSATRLKRFTPTVLPPAAEPSNRHAGVRGRGIGAVAARIGAAAGPIRRGFAAIKLREIAHSRTGDKGNTSNISVIAYDEGHYRLLLDQVTSARVKAHFAGVVEGEVVRYELPDISALNFVMTRALGGGVTRSLALDRDQLQFRVA